MIRQAITPTFRTIQRRNASTALSPHTAFEQLGMKPLKDAKISGGNTAYVWEVPKDLPVNDFIKRRKAIEDHAASTTDLWRKISFYVCIPGVLVTSIWVYKAEQVHAAHHAHLVEMNGGEEPERKVYSYMNIRNKPFPWGNQSLFFNPKVNIPVEEP